MGGATRLSKAAHEAIKRLFRAGTVYPVKLSGYTDEIAIKFGYKSNKIKIQKPAEVLSAKTDKFKFDLFGKTFKVPYKPSFPGDQKRMEALVSEIPYERAKWNLLNAGMLAEVLLKLSEMICDKPYKKPFAGFMLYRFEEIFAAFDAMLSEIQTGIKDIKGKQEKKEVTILWEEQMIRYHFYAELLLKGQRHWKAVLKDKEIKNDGRVENTDGEVGQQELEINNDEPEKKEDEPMYEDEKYISENRDLDFEADFDADDED